jgi:hypothetical protein
MLIPASQELRQLRHQENPSTTIFGHQEVNPRASSSSRTRMASSELSAPPPTESEKVPLPPPAEPEEVSSPSPEKVPPPSPEKVPPPTPSEVKPPLPEELKSPQRKVAQ